MADTQRTIAQILALLADNTTGDISPQDIRDAVVSLRNARGQIYVSSPLVTNFPNTTDFVELTQSTWDLSVDGALFDGSDGNGRLTYTGIVPVSCYITASVSATLAGNNDIIHFRIGRNATTDQASEIAKFIGTGASMEASSLHLVETLEPGDYVSLWCRNETATDAVTIRYGNIQVISLPI